MMTAALLATLSLVLLPAAPGVAPLGVPAAFAEADPELELAPEVDPGLTEDRDVEVPPRRPSLGAGLSAFGTMVTPLALYDVFQVVVAVAPPVLGAAALALFMVALVQGGGGPALFYLVMIALYVSYGASPFLVGGLLAMTVLGPTLGAVLAVGMTVPALLVARQLFKRRIPALPVVLSGTGVAAVGLFTGVGLQALSVVLTTAGMLGALLGASAAVSANNTPAIFAAYLGVLGVAVGGTAFLLFSPLVTAGITHVAASSAVAVLSTFLGRDKAPTERRWYLDLLRVPTE